MWWRWYYWACPVAWTLYGLVASQYGDVEDMLESGETVKDFLRSYFGYTTDFLGVVAVVIVWIPLFFGFIFALSIKALNFQKKWVLIILPYNPRYAPFIFIIVSFKKSLRGNLHNITRRGGTTLVVEEVGILNLIFEPPKKIFFYFFPPNIKLSHMCA